MIEKRRFTAFKTKRYDKGVTDQHHERKKQANRCKEIVVSITYCDLGKHTFTL